MREDVTSGILNIDKPYGMTSMEVVRRIKRASGIRRVGHGGTLDPIATGVIPVCVGRATRLMEYVIGGPKEYLGEVTLGVSTDTYDAMGEVTSERDASTVNADSVRDVLPRFEGRIEQVPPMYSALKKDGRRLYDLARDGIEVEREARPMVVYHIELEDWTPPVASVRVRCGRGFYMRSLAHDIGEMLGCGGHLKSLVRLATGPFQLEDAVALEDAQQSFEDATWADIVHPPDSVLESMRALILGQQHQKLVINGRPIPATGAAIDLGASEERCRAYSTDGRFLAILRCDLTRRQWLPERVFAA